MEKIPVEDVLRAIRELCGQQDGFGSATRHPERATAWIRLNEELRFLEHAENLKSG
jgi:hypothetical protein